MAEGLTRAAAQGNVSEIEKFLVDTKKSLLKLMEASVINDQHEVVKQLLNSDFRHLLIVEYSPLWNAVKHKSKKVVRALLDHPNVNPNAPAGHQHFTPLMQAVFLHDVELTALLLSSPKVDPNGASRCMKTAHTIHSPLHMSMSLFRGSDDTQSARIVDLLVHHGAAVNAADQHGHTPLFLGFTVQQGQPKHTLRVSPARCLINSCAKITDNTVLDLDKPNGAGMETALHAATRGRNLEAVALLLAAGARPDVVNVDGQTPLLLACIHDDGDIVHSLLEAGANPNIQGYLNRKPSTEASCNADGPCACIARRAKGHALFPALHNNNRSVLRALVYAGAHLYLRNDHGVNPLYYAIQVPDICLHTVLYFLELGARFDLDLNALAADDGPHGEVSTLMAAGSHCCADAIYERMIRLGADVRFTNSQAQTAFKHAVVHNHFRAVRVLLRYLDLRWEPEWELALHSCALRDSIVTAWVLLRHNWDPDVSHSNFFGSLAVEMPLAPQEMTSVSLAFLQGHFHLAIMLTRLGCAFSQKTLKKCLKYFNHNLNLSDVTDQPYRTVLMSFIKYTKCTLTLKQLSRRCVLQTLRLRHVGRDVTDQLAGEVPAELIRYLQLADLREVDLGDFRQGNGHHGKANYEHYVAPGGHAGHQEQVQGEQEQQVEGEQEQQVEGEQEQQVEGEQDQQVELEEGEHQHQH